MATWIIQPTPVSILDGQWSLGEYSGTITVLRRLSPQQKIAPIGSTTTISGVDNYFVDFVNTTGIKNTTAGFDPSIIFQLSTKLRTTGQIWPCGFS
jgi:hypothetical protein